MRLSAEQIAAIRQEAERFLGIRVGVWLSGSRVNNQRGFTLMELITVMVIIGIVSVVALPKFFDRSAFDSRAYYDQAIATLRYAQKAAIAQRRYVCVTFAADKITLAQGTTSACGAALAGPGGQAEIKAPAGVTLSGYADFSFDALGKPSAAQSIAVSGYGTAITVEAETGYVH